MATPAQIADKWRRNLQNAQQDIQQGVEAMTQNPMDAAVASQSKMVNNWNAAINSGKWAANTQAVSLQQWRTAFITKGLPRISAGAQAAQPKVQAFHAELQPFQANLKTQIAAMPDDTITDSEQRMIAWMRGMAQFRQT